jgi:carbonic anhydrase
MPIRPVRGKLALQGAYMRLNRIFLAGILGHMLCCSLAMTARQKAAFSYSGDTGPGFWGEINPACAGSPTSRQSPIDIHDAEEDPRLIPLDVVLGETSFTLTNPGYTVLATPETAGILALNGTTFSLVQFHFHTLAEHTVNGRRAVMELHAVFKDASSNFAVIGVLYSIGRTSSFLAKILSAGLPEKTTSPAVTVTGLNLGTAFTDLSSYYTYPGSLNTPPCSDNVTWLVIERSGATITLTV